MKPKKILEEIKDNPGTALLAGVGAVGGAYNVSVRPLFRKDSDSKAGTSGWVALGLGVLAWDVIAPETLSHAYKRGLEHPRYKYMCAGLLGATALHLLGWPK